MGLRRWLPQVFVGAGVVVLLIVGGCGDKNCPPNAPCPTPTPGSGGGGCVNVSGTRNMFWSDSCGNKGSGQISLTQVTCTFGGNLTGLGTFAGTVSGNNLSYTLTFSSPCGGTATGTGMVTGSSVNGTYTGTQTGAAPCCATVTGDFSFDFATTPVPTTATPTPGVGF